MSTRAPVEGFGAGARAVTAVNVVILAGLAFAVVVVLNLVMSQVTPRWDWTSAAALQLSEKTTTFLAESVDTQMHPVRMYVFYPSWSAYRLSTRRDEVFAVHHLARELDLASDQLTLETLDPEQNRSRVDLLRRQFAISDAEFAQGVVAFEYRGRHKYVTDLQIFESDMEALREAGGGRQVPKNFHGEDRFLAAIQGLVIGSVPKAAILVGHGELDPRSETAAQACARVETALKRDTYEVDVLDLKGHSVIRKDYDVICVLAPRLRLPPTAIAALRSHLERGGGLLVCAGPILDARPDGSVIETDTGLEELLADSGIHIQTDLVFASAADPTGRQMQFSPVFSPRMDAEHTITKTLTYEKGRLVVFAEVRRVTYDDKGRNRTQGGPLAYTDEGGRRVTDFVAYVDSSKDPVALRAFLGDDRRHPPAEIPVAAASQTLRPAAGTGHPTRVVVFGSSSWCNDASRPGPYDMDLLLNASNWIARRETLVGIGAKDATKVRFDMTAAQRDRMFWIGVVFLPIFVGLLGALAWWWRKREGPLPPARANATPKADTA